MNLIEIAHAIENAKKVVADVKTAYNDAVDIIEALKVKHANEIAGALLVVENKAVAVAKAVAEVKSLLEALAKETGLTHEGSPAVETPVNGQPTGAELKSLFLAGQKLVKK